MTFSLSDSLWMSLCACPFWPSEFVCLHIKYQLLIVFLPTSGHFGFQQHSCSVLGLQTSVITLCTSCEEALVIWGFVPVTWSLHGAFCKSINSFIVCITCKERCIFCTLLCRPWILLQLSAFSYWHLFLSNSNKQPISLTMFVIWNLYYTECKTCSS